jgi:hypothetical protein
VYLRKYPRHPLHPQQHKIHLTHYHQTHLPSVKKIILADPHGPRDVLDLQNIY